MKIKVCGMRDNQNILSLEALSKVDFLGHIFYAKSKRNVTQKLLGNKPKIGVFVNEAQNRILELHTQYDFWAVQLHGAETPEFCLELKNKLRVIKAFGIHSDFDFGRLESYKNAVDYFLFDTEFKGQTGGTGQKFNWEILNKYTLDVPYFLSGGIGENDWKYINTIEDKRLFAIDINSKFETQPALKNITLVKKFIQQLQSD